MSIAIQPAGIRYYNSRQINHSTKSNEQTNVNFKAFLPTKEDKILATVGVLGGLGALSGILDKAGVEFFAKLDIPVAITTMCAMLPVISTLGIFGCKSKTS